MTHNRQRTLKLIALALIGTACLSALVIARPSSPRARAERAAEELYDLGRRAFGLRSGRTSCGSGLKQIGLALHTPAPASAAAKPGPAGDWPLFGGTPARNMVNLAAKGLPTEWTVPTKDSKGSTNVKWVAQLGNKAYGGPVVAGGKVFVGTNNAVPRDPKVKGQKAVLMCFNEADGKFLWQAVHEIPADLSLEAPAQGLCSTPTVEGDRLYYVTPACEVVCAGVQDGKEVWKLDLMKEFKVHPYHLAAGSPLVVGDLVMVVSGNGRDERGNLPSPKAPSFLAVNKNTGKVAWQSDLPGDRIIQGQWSNPTYAEVNGKGQVIFPGGDAWLYSFEPATGKLIWKFNCTPNEEGAKDNDGIGNYIVATPVVYDNKLFIGLGLMPDTPEGPRYSYLLCVDVTKTGDVSPPKGSFDAGASENKDSALMWAFGGMLKERPKTGRQVVFGRTMSTVAVHDGLVYAAEENGYLNCLDAKTGKRYWEHDLRAGVWGSPLWADGKVYLGSENSEVVVFAHGKEKKVLAEVNMEEVVPSTPVVANGVLYVQTKSKLYAIAGK